MVTWSAVPGQTYRLQFIDTPGSTNWNDVPPDITATESTISATNAGVNSTLRLYRVLKLP